MAGVTDTLADYVATSTYEALPAAVRHEGVRAFVNWVGCAAGGSRDDTVEHALEVVTEFSGAGNVSVVGRPERLDALNATFINTMSSSALMFHDTHFATVAHPTSAVAATLMALAERQPLTGPEFLHALILGIEIQCRVGNILSVPPAECTPGLSMGGLVGGIGAAVAAGKVLGLDQPGIVTAIGLAANQASGLRRAQTSMAAIYTPANVARGGLMAALMAARGFTCADAMIEGANGFAAAYGVSPNVAAATEKLGTLFETSSLSYKPYPNGFASHPVIDACLEVAQQDGFDAARVERIELVVNPIVTKLMDRPHPKSRDEAIMGVQHWAAAALVYKAAGIVQRSEAVARDPLVCDLRRKVVIQVDASMERAAAEVRVLLKGGGSLRANVMHCRGSAGRPMSDDDISDKTRAQLRTVFSAFAAEHIITECWRIANYPAVGTLCPQLSAALASSSPQ